MFWENTCDQNLELDGEGEWYETAGGIFHFVGQGKGVDDIQSMVKWFMCVCMCGGRM